MGKIKNFKELATSDLRKAALAIAEAGLAAVDTDAVIRSAVRIEEETLHLAGEAIPLSSIKRLFVVGAGKCAMRAVATLEEILGNRIAGGAVIDVQQWFLKRVKYFKGDHPYPTPKNTEGAAKIIEILNGAEEGDLVLAIVSGGGSTLLAVPPEGWTVEKEVAVVKPLFRAGADIVELNTIRKHLSRARGGYLASYAHPARVVALVMSDVPGDKLEFISSGPFVKDTTTVEDARAILEKYGVEKAIGFPVEGLVETPKDDEHFKNVRNVLIVSNQTALRAMEAAAKAQGFSPRTVTNAFNGEARTVAATVISDLAAAPAGSALLYGGESTVTIRGKGTGGRNQELALAALPSVKPGELILSFASDGHDNTDAAGALCDIMAKNKAKELKIDSTQYLEENDSYSFFERVGAQVVTGDTGSNISDLVIALRE